MPINYVHLPGLNVTKRSHRKNFISGNGLGGGMGSVLLRIPGPGGASSYSDMDDYIETTKFNPLKGDILNKISGLGVSKPIKRKNITMTI